MTVKKKAIEGKIEPGDMARCKVTLIEGIVTVRHDYLYGSPRIGIQPSGSHNGKEHEGIHVDIQQAELLKKTAVSRDGTKPVRNIHLGDKCKDIITGFEGICTGVAEWLYSCTKIMVQPEKLEPKTGKPADPHWFDEPQVKCVKAKKMETKQKETGGFGKPVYKDNRHSSSGFKGSKF